MIFARPALQNKVAGSRKKGTHKKNATGELAIDVCHWMDN